MKKFLNTVVLFSFIFLIGCASLPTEEEISNADYGFDVSVSSCKDVAELFIKDKMKDPSSAQFTDFECYAGYEGNVPIAGVSATFGYRFYGQVNAKNSFGGYTGYSPFAGIVRDDGNGPKVVRYCITDSNSEYQICIPQMVEY